MITHLPARNTSLALEISLKESRLLPALSSREETWTAIRALCFHGKALLGILADAGT